MSRSGTSRAMRPVAIAVTLGAMLAGCSDIYYDRRDTIALSGGDAIAANAVAQTVDPWPAHSGNTTIAFNGQKMQSAVERYRTNKVTQPVKPTTSDVQNQQESQAAAVAATGTQNAPAASAPVASSAAATQ